MQPFAHRFLEEHPGDLVGLARILGHESLELSQGQRIYETLSAPKALEVIEQAVHNDIAAYPRYYRSLLAFIRDPAGFTA